MKLKDLKPGATVRLSELSSDSHETKPPARLSEVKLVATLESLDIGRPSTYSSIVSLIQDRGYVAKKGSQLYPTALGFAVARLLSAKLPSFTAYDYTAKMEADLDSIADGAQTREKFLASFWNGTGGFAALIESLSNSIDFNELEELTRIDLHNGYSIRFSKFGTFLQDDGGQPDAKGYLPSARLDDAVDIFDYKDAALCAEAIEKALNKVEARELGILENGEYVGWTVWARDGRHGPYLQALHPAHSTAVAAGKKPAASVPSPINYPIPEELALETVELEQVSELFADVKLPRWSQDKLWLTGVGKRGAYIGKKSTPKSRPVFRSLKEPHDPKTITFEEVEALWKAADQEAANKPKPKAKPRTKKAPAKANAKPARKSGTSSTKR